MSEAERAEQAWDEQIERDEAAGRLDALIDRGRAEHRAGRTAPLHPIESTDLFDDDKIPSPPDPRSLQGQDVRHDPRQGEEQ